MTEAPWRPQKAYQELSPHCMFCDPKKVMSSYNSPIFKHTGSTSNTIGCCSLQNIPMQLTVFETPRASRNAKNMAEFCEWKVWGIIAGWGLGLSNFGRPS